MSVVDLERLGSWLEAQGVPGPISDVQELSGGTQNILLRLRCGDRDLVLRHPPEHKRANSDELMRREARVLAALDGTDVPHPPLVAACGDAEVLGSAFYVSEYVPGSNPHHSLPPPYAADPAWRRALGLALADGLAAIAAVDYVAVGLADYGKADGFLERQVPRWRAELESYTQLPGYPRPEIPSVDAVGGWLERNQPSSWQPGLIHGDYHLSNVLCAPERPAVAAVVDWELSTIGDPLLDLGWLLTSWPGASGPTPRSVGAEPWAGFPTAEELLARYAERSSRDLSAMAWYEALACYKIGIVLEGTHARALSGMAPTETGDHLHTITLDLFGRAREIIASS